MLLGDSQENQWTEGEHVLRAPGVALALAACSTPRDPVEAAYDHCVGQITAKAWGEADRTTSFTTGPAMISYVDMRTLEMTVTQDGKVLASGKAEVAAGSACTLTPERRGCEEPR